MRMFKMALPVLLLLVFTRSAGAASFLEELIGESDLKEVHDVRQDIEILNLLNVLYLGDEQIDSLLAIHDRREAIVDTLKTRLSGQARAAVRTFSALRHALLAGRDPEERLIGDIHRTDHELMTDFQEAIKGYKDLADEAEAVLNESQKVVVRYYVTCIIPPQNEINPIRVGESGGEGSRPHLEKLRDMTEEQYQAHKPMIVEKMYGHLEKFAKAHPHVTVEGAREKIAGYLDKIRAMPEVEFKLYEGNPLKEILGPPPEEHQEGEIRPKILKFILGSRSAVLLRQLKSRDR